ncbi:MAG: metal-dependent transcriptional regulator [Chloroflexia bacterium]|nr:metal-dependent transcriptional regulator [Chloroflexia bacterium]
MSVRDQTLGRAGTNYLKAICELQENSDKAITSAVAAHLSVSNPSATRMMKKLADLGLVERTPYHGAKLTPAGEALASRAGRRRNLIERYLIEFIGFSAVEAGIEANRLEHAVSEKLEHHIETLLGGLAAVGHDDSGHPADD